MSRMKEAFQKGKAFIPFIVCGDPDLRTTEEIVREMAKGGADLIGLCIPFSDPAAEGAAVMEAELRALRGGTTTDAVFSLTREIRRELSLPLIYRSYANVVFSYGTERFMKEAAEAGADALILPDVPFEEREEFLGAAKKHGICLISMLAPSPEKRALAIAGDSEGFLCLLPSPDAGAGGLSEMRETAKRIREKSGIPLVIDFGEKGEEEAGEAAAFFDGLIAMPALPGQGKAEYAGAYAKRMAEDVHRAR